MAAELRDALPHEALDFLVLAWHHDHLVYQSKAKQKHYHRCERDFYLACADGLLGDTFDTLKILVFDKLDSIVRASSLVEMVNSLIRPYLNSCKGQITQESLNLIMFYHNHRRYKSGRRKGKAPIELLTGKPLEAPWWELLGQQIKIGQNVTRGDLSVKAPFHLVLNHDRQTEQRTMAPGQTIVALADDSDSDGQQTALAAA